MDIARCTRDGHRPISTGLNTLTVIGYAGPITSSHAINQTECAQRRQRRLHIHGKFGEIVAMAAALCRSPAHVQVRGAQSAGQSITKMFIR